MLPSRSTLTILATLGSASSSPTITWQPTSARTRCGHQNGGPRDDDHRSGP
jgi:hypothetical protein